MKKWIIIAVLCICSCAPSVSQMTIYVADTVERDVFVQSLQARGVSYVVKKVDDGYEIKYQDKNQ